MTDDMASWGWSSWLFFSVFLLAAAAFGFTARDLIRQVRGEAPVKIEFGEPFTLTQDHYPQFVGRFVALHQQYMGGTRLEAVDEHTFRQDHHIPPDSGS